MTAPATIDEADLREARVAELIAQFQAADRAMAEMPIYNPALAVEVVNVRDWQGLWLMAVVTPWFLNLVLLAPDPGAWAHHQAGDKVTWTLPTGDYAFIVGPDGAYQSCSLFSPVFEFGDQAAARAVAAACVEMALDPQLDARPDDPASSAVDPECDSEADEPDGQESPDLTRRGLLRGDWRREAR